MIGLLPALILLMLPGPSIQEARLTPSQVIFYLSVLEGDSAAKLVPGGAKVQPDCWQARPGTPAALADDSGTAILPAKDDRTAPTLLTGSLRPRDGPAGRTL